MITIQGKKMGKSYNNFINLEEFFTGSHPLLEQAYSPMVIRFFILGAHYRSTVDFSNEALQAAEKGLARLLDASALLEGLKVSEHSTIDLSGLERRCLDALNDDLNSPMVIAELFEASRMINAVHAGLQTISQADLEELKRVYRLMLHDLLGITADNASGSTAQTAYAGAVDLLLSLRASAKANKDWATSDRIRDELTALGFVIKDTKEGTEWKLG